MFSNAKTSSERLHHGNIRITSRDIEVLLSIAQNQFLTTSQICTKHFPSIERTRKRLYLLYQNKYINRMKIPIGIEGLPAESVISISRVGMQMLQLFGKLPHNTSLPKTGRRPGNFMFLNHTLMRNSFRIALETAVKKDMQISLHNWNHHNSITKYVSLPDSKTHSLKSVALKADAYFRLERDRRGFECYLEVDNGTMALDRLITKMKQYHKWHYMNSRYSDEQRINRRFLILVFSKRRAKNITDKLRIIAKSHQVSNSWLVANIERNELIQTNVLTALPWSNPTPLGNRKVTLRQELSQFASRQNVSNELYL